MNANRGHADMPRDAATTEGHDSLEPGTTLPLSADFIRSYNEQRVVYLNGQTYKVKELRLSADGHLVGRLEPVSSSS